MHTGLLKSKNKLNADVTQLQAETEEANQEAHNGEDNWCKISVSKRKVWILFCTLQIMFGYQFQGSTFWNKMKLNYQYEQIWIIRPFLTLIVGCQNEQDIKSYLERLKRNLEGLVKDLQQTSDSEGGNLQKLEAWVANNNTALINSLIFHLCMYTFSKMRILSFKQSYYCFLKQYHYGSSKMFQIMVQVRKTGPSGWHSMWRCI